MIIHVEKDKQELPLVKLTDISQLTTSVNAIFRQIFRKTVANRPKSSIFALQFGRRRAKRRQQRLATLSPHCHVKLSAMQPRPDETLPTA